MLMLLAALALQSDRPQSNRLPPANPVPLTDDAAPSVMVPVNALLAAIAARDGAAVRALARPDAGVTVAVEQADGSRTLRRSSWTSFAERFKPGPERFEERLADVAVEVDGDVAMVWAPYTFRIDGRIDHCGVDHIGLVRENGRWTIESISWSQRGTGCAG